MRFSPSRRPWLVLAAGLAAAATAATPVLAAAAVPVVRAPARVVALRLADARRHPKARQIGVGITLDKGLADGAWSLQGTQAVWRLSLASDSATALALTLTGLALPAGASLTWASGDGRVVQGPYTARDVPASGVLDTPMVPGAAGVLTLTMPALDTAGAALTVHTLQHVYANVPRTEGDSSSGVAAKDASGACEIDVACPTGDNWRNEIRATVLYTLHNSANTELFACSGGFLNNTNNSEDPLLYTANHCVSGNVPSSVVVYYNFQKAACNGAAMSLDGWTQTQTGATLLDAGASADYALLRLSSAIASARNVYFNAWNASATSTASSGVDIHHPSADVKKISTYSNAARASISFNGATDQVWGVNWTAGTTEEGSSGSNLINQDRQVIGALSGGEGACSTTTPTQNNGQTDYFGRLDAAYAASSAIRTALDPAGGGKATTACAKTQGVAGCATGGSSSTTTTPSSGTTTTTTGTTAAPTTGGGGGGGALGEGLLAGLLGLGLARRRRAG